MRSSSLLLLTVSVALSWFTAAGRAQTPSYDEAWKFCAELQGDYNQRQLPALIERIDSERMFLRMATPLGEEEAKRPDAKATWEKSFFPMAKAELGNLQAYTRMSVDQIGLLDGRRVAICILTDPKGLFTALTLWLERRADGTLAIADFRGMGQQLESTRRMRQLVILFSGAFNSTLDEDDRTISLCQEAAPQLKAYLKALSAGKLDDAFAQLQLMPDRLRATKLWEDLADALALAGSGAARAHAFRVAKSGGPLNPILALSAKPEESTGPEMILAALDVLDRRALHCPYLRAVRADILANFGRPAESLALARATYELNPFSALACAVAARAAALLQRPTDALHALRAWARLVPPQTIDAQLATDSQFAALRATAGYQAWLRETPVKAQSGS